MIRTNCVSLPGNRAATRIFLWIIQEIQPVVLVVFFIIDVLIVYDLKPCTEEVVPFLRRLIPKDHFANRSNIHRDILQHHAV